MRWRKDGPDYYTGWGSYPPVRPGAIIWWMRDGGYNANAWTATKSRQWASPYTGYFTTLAEAKAAVERWLEMHS